METIYCYTVFMLSTNYNLSILMSNFTSHSMESFPKCCPENQSFSFTKKECIRADFGTCRLPCYENLTTHSGQSNSKIHCGYQFSNSDASWSFDKDKVMVDEYFHNGNVNIRVGMENKFRQLESDTYCLEEERETTNPILIVCDAEPSPSIFSTILGFFCLLSFLLIVTTFIIYLAIPELRKKVKDRCFICYLASHIINIILLATEIYDDPFVNNGTYLTEV